MTIPLRQQLLLGCVLLLATAVGIRNIAATRNEAAVGGRAHPLEAARADEMAAFARILGVIEGLGRRELAGRLRTLQERGGIWVAPGLGAGHWALYVDTFGLVRRVYLRDVALRSPEAHLYPEADATIPGEKRRAFAGVSLAGALFHELQHWDGVEDESAAYDLEIAWLESLRGSLPRDLTDPERSALDWGIESAVLSARKARALATASP
ncbi:MAG TPA: hypothetical protein VFM88_17730 [Vicinamibacteria bacterium]|nr:hypothetical protein [Vicinamibacteria bacterium]